MEYQCSRERFLEDIKDHEVNIIKDDGLYRHIRFKRPDSTTYYFDLITWRGHLCITGDMGCWVFSRLTDMFDFFIMDENDFNKKHVINPGYWSEKIQAFSGFGGGAGNSEKEFSSELFKETVKEQFDRYFSDIDEEDEEALESKQETWGEIQEEILWHIEDYGGSPGILFSKLHDFSYNDFYFQDFPFESCYKFTHHYIWICYAIVWGIIEYKKLKKDLT